MKQFAGKPQTYWAINRNGMVEMHTLSFSRKEAIEKLLTGSGMNWSECKILGYKAMKIKITIDIT